MRRASLVAVLTLGPACPAADLKGLPANTFVEIAYTTAQPADPAEKGRFARQGWNKVVYDPTGKRVLFYDRWVDQRHGGQTIYGNCLFAFDPAAGTLTPVKIDHWTKAEPKGGGYRTVALPADEAEPTPCPRHVYHAFEVVPDLDAVFLCNGANQTVLDRAGKLVGHDACDGTWKLDLKTNTWARVGSREGPRNRLDEAMCYCPDAKALVYAGADGQVWVMGTDKGEWRKARASPPVRTAMGRTAFYDPSKKRVLLAGGGRLDAWQKGEAREFRAVYGFDPKAETVERLADAPTALYSAHLAYDSKRKVFLTAAVFDKGEQPSGMFAYDPAADAWSEVKPANPIPPHKTWMGWTQMCYSPDHDCLICKVNDKFFAFRYSPDK
jgi:hypothetical protein